MTIFHSGVGNSTPDGPESRMEIPAWLFCWLLDQVGGHVVLNAHEVIVATEKVVIQNPSIESFQQNDPFHLHIRVVYKDEYK